MEISREEYERYLFFEAQKEQAEREHQANKNDPQVLLRWGGSLLELAHFRQGPESMKTLEQAADKFLKALTIDEKMHEAMWCLGNALTSQGLLQSEASKAHKLFDDAAVYFKKAIEQQPANPNYQRAVEMIGKAPEIYAELQVQLKQQEMVEQASASGRGGSSSGRARTTSSRADFWYDLGGWVLLAGLITGFVVMQSRSAPPAPASG